MQLYVFDLDKTLINGDSNELWHKYLYELGILNDEFMQKDKELMDLYALGKLDMDEYLSFALLALKTLSLSQIDELMQKFLQTKIKPIIYKQTNDILKKAKNKIIISATPEFIVSPIAKFLGVDECVGMRLVEQNGYYTNKYKLPLSYKEGKVQCLKQWLNEKNLKPKHITFYTDSINDLPLCNYADEAICINADEMLKQIAREKNWDILQWNC